MTSAVLTMATQRMFVDASPVPLKTRASDVSSAWTVRSQAGLSSPRTVTVGVHPVAMAADERAGRVFILNQETSTRTGTVSVLAATTGLVLKTIAVGYQPSALAVDEPTGHVFVTSQSASVPRHDAFAALIGRVQEFMAVTPGSNRGIVTILNTRT